MPSPIMLRNVVKIIDILIVKIFFWFSLYKIYLSRNDHDCIARNINVVWHWMLLTLNYLSNHLALQWVYTNPFNVWGFITLTAVSSDHTHQNAKVMFITYTLSAERFCIHCIFCNFMSFLSPAVETTWFICLVTKNKIRSWNMKYFWYTNNMIQSSMHTIQHFQLLKAKKLKNLNQLMLKNAIWMQDIVLHMLCMYNITICNITFRTWMND
jgi:hypothetical protein